jgi:hypothetical protein
MTQDEIIVLANKAGWDVLDLDDGFGIRLKEFAALVEEQATAKEREACAKLADEYATWGGSNFYDWFKKLAAAIRARGEQA